MSWTRVAGNLIQRKLFRRLQAYNNFELNIVCLRYITCIAWNKCFTFTSVGWVWLTFHFHWLGLSVFPLPLVGSAWLTFHFRWLGLADFPLQYVRFVCLSTSLVRSAWLTFHFRWWGLHGWLSTSVGGVCTVDFPLPFVGFGRLLIFGHACKLTNNVIFVNANLGWND